MMENVIERIFATGAITRYDQNWLCEVMLSNKALNNEENRKVRKLHEHVRMGFVRIID
ncbi:MAG: hypothetical protein KI793_30805 [Rivularia sp. (in: Bacteria)]|nr:hypothetical protein [Rivularia sp. MS3]